MGPKFIHDFSIFCLELSVLKDFVKNKALYLNLHRLFYEEWNVFLCRHVSFCYITEYNFVQRENSIEKIFSMAVSEEVMDCCFGASWQTLRLTWNIITYRFARSIVTNVHKIFDYIYHFSFHVSSDVQTDRLFGVVTTLGNKDYED